MERQMPDDALHDHLATQIQEALSRGLIKRNSPGHDVAKALLDGTWKDLNEEQRAVFNKYVSPILEE